MSVVCSLQNTTKEFQKIIVDTITVRSKKKHQGKWIFGDPMKLYQLSQDKKWVSLPLYEGKKVFKPSQIYSYAHFQPDRPHMKFTGTLLETERQDQVSAMAEALPMLMKESTVTLALKTGHGKCSECYFLVNQVKKRTLIVLCQTVLIKNWVSDGKRTNNNIMAIESTKITTISDDVDVIICMDTRLCAIPDNVANSIGTLVLDEAVDFCTAKRYASLMRFHPQYVIAATATPTRGSDGLHCMLELMVGEHKIVRINQIPFNVIKMSTGVIPNTIESAQGTDWTYLSYDLFLNERRNRIVLDCILANIEEHKIMILTDFGVSVDLIYDLCKLYDIDVSKFSGSQKSYENARVLIGSSAKIGQGFDECGTCSSYDGIRIDLIIFIASTKQEEVLLQYLGRAFRAENPNMIHFSDNHRILKNHWKLSVPVYEKVKGVITEASWDKPYFVKDDILFKQRHNECLKNVLSILESKKQVPVYADVLRERLVKDGVIKNMN